MLLSLNVSETVRTGTGISPNNSGSLTAQAIAHKQWIACDFEMDVGHRRDEPSVRSNSRTRLDHISRTWKLCTPMMESSARNASRRNSAVLCVTASDPDLSIELKRGKASSSSGIYKKWDLARSTGIEPLTPNAVSPHRTPGSCVQSIDIRHAFPCIIAFTESDVLLMGRGSCYRVRDDPLTWTLSRIR